MVEWHTKSKRKKNGGKRKTLKRCNKKKSWRGGSAANTKATKGEKENRDINKGRGKTIKVRLTSTEYANVTDGKKIIRAQILEVTENNANRLFARSNTATKGSKIKVKLGKDEKIAIITNRPGQDGIINAKLA
ncbi:MAG: 30S ribosomal protein S8e [Candidatus ainarchaeum sp.]|nr:30S ribosomal protein S8e [Candidatus ainarchaeum sp.]